MLCATSLFYCIRFPCFIVALPILGGLAGSAWCAPLPFLWGASGAVRSFPSFFFRASLCNAYMTKETTEAQGNTLLSVHFGAAADSRVPSIHASEAPLCVYPAFFHRAPLLVISWRLSRAPSACGPVRSFFTLADVRPISCLCTATTSLATWRRQLQATWVSTCK